MPDTHPYVHRIEVPVPPQATAGNDLTTMIGRAPFAGTVTGVSYSPNAAITGGRYRIVVKKSRRPFASRSSARTRKRQLARTIAAAPKAATTP